MARRQNQSLVASSDWQATLKQLRAVSPELEKVMKKEIRKGAHVVKRDAAAGFRDYSKRIPRAVKVQVTSRVIAVRLDRKVAPHAAVNERGGRHPVFGNRHKWVRHEARPRLEPAIRRGRPAIQKQIVDEETRLLKTKLQ